MEENNDIVVSRFKRYELLFFRIQLGMFSFGVVLLALVYVGFESLGNAIDSLAYIAFAGIIVPIILFVISLIRMIIYFTKIRVLDPEVGIWRSALAFIFSPLNIGIYYSIFFILVLASCAANA